MKIVFAGTPEFAAYALNKLIEEGHDIRMVLTQPDRPSGRGRKLKASAVKEVALKAGIPVETPLTFRRAKGGEETAAVYDKLREIDPDLLIVAAYGLILPQELLELPKGIWSEYPNLKAVNIHGSLLPDWRGAAPIARGLEKGDKEAGVTLMQMDVGLDTGPMLYKKAIPITEEDTAGTLTEKVGKLGAEMLAEYLKDPTKYPPVAQPEEASYASKLEKAEGVIDWNQPAQVIVNKICAFNPFPGTSFKHGETDLKAWFAVCEKDKEYKEPAGTVLSADAKGVRVCAGDGKVVCLKELQRPGGKKLPAREFLAGHPIKEKELLQ